MQELIKVTQLPIIEEQLRAHKADVEKRVRMLMLMDCTDENLQAVKAARAQLRKDFDALEAERKKAKEAIMAPYNRFDAVYKECVSGPMTEADNDLRDKIAAVENGLRKICEDRLHSYFDELCEAANIDFLTWDRLGIRVDMTSARAKTPTKLMEQIQKVVTGAAQDLSAILSMEDADEILMEYKRCLNLAQAVAAVRERAEMVRKAEEHRRMLEAAKADQEARRAATLAAAQEAAEAQALTAPVKVAPAQPIQAPEDPVLTLTFTVTAPKSKLRLLKQWLQANGYDAH